MQMQLQMQMQMQMQLPPPPAASLISESLVLNNIEEFSMKLVAK